MIQRASEIVLSRLAWKSAKMLSPYRHRMFLQYLVVFATHVIQRALEHPTKFTYRRLFSSPCRLTCRWSEFPSSGRADCRPQRPQLAPFRRLGRVCNIHWRYRSTTVGIRVTWVQRLKNALICLMHDHDNAHRFRLYSPADFWISQLLLWI